MWKKCLSLLIAATLAITVSAQEESPVDSTSTDTDVAAEDAAVSTPPGESTDDESPAGSAQIEDAAEEDPEIAVFDEAFEEVDLDEQTYEEDDDDFVPTEEIPADEPIPFPSNI